MITKEWQPVTRFALLSAAAILGFLLAPPASTPTLPSQAVVNQLAHLLQETGRRAGDHKNLTSHWAYALQASRCRAIAGLSEVYASARDAVAADAAGRAKVD